jgi:hypothetical protein
MAMLNNQMVYPAFDHSTYESLGDLAGWMGGNQWPSGCPIGAKN